MSRAAKQSYLGRVIGPARYHEGHGNSRPYLSFSLFVDRLAVKAEDKKERASGRIYCSYSVQSENDPVATILCNIVDSKTGAGNLNGHTYKSVEVWVEGNEKLTEVKAFDDKGQPLHGAYYKSLEFCTVQILDRSLIKLLRGEDVQGGSHTEAQANVAPSSTRASASAAPNRKAYQAGDRIVNEGKTYEFLGGDQSNMSNWTLVEDQPQPVAQKAPAPSGQVKQPSNPFKAQGTSSIRSMLEDDNDGPTFGAGNRPPV